MSFMAPVPAQGSKLPIRAAKDVGGLPERQSTVTDGPPFRQELHRALGHPKLLATALTPNAGSVEQAGTAPERLDPQGAALRALLGGQAESAHTDVVPVAAAPTDAKVQTDPQSPAESLAAIVAASVPIASAQSVLPVVTPAAGAQTASNLAPVGSQQAPDSALVGLTAASVASLSNLDPASAAIQTNQDPASVASQPVPQPTAKATPTPMINPVLFGQVVTQGAPSQTVETGPAKDQPATADQATGDQRPAGGSSKPLQNQRPTFSDLVELITTSQAQDGAQSTKPVQVAQQRATAAEPVLKLVTAPAHPVAADSAEDGGTIVHSLELPRGGTPVAPHSAPAETGPARSAPLPAPAILNQVARSIRVLAEGARSELQVKLHPAELGEILVRLTIQDGVLQARLQTTDASVKATLDANLDALKARFEQHGLQVSSLTVSTGAGHLTDDGQAKSGWAQQTSEQGRRSGSDSEDEELDSQPKPTAARRILGRRSTGRLDHLA